MLSFDPEIHGGHIRPKSLIPKYGLVSMLEKVIQKCPNQIKVKWGDEEIGNI
jgi:hypothetical protein